MSPQPRIARSVGRLADALSLALLGVVAIIAALTFRHYGLGWDDYTHAEYGGLLLRLYGSGFTDQRALSFVNLYAYGGGFDMLAALVAKVLPFDLFETRRLVGAAVGIAGLFIVWRIARRLGGPLAGLLALALLSTCPLYYGHMFINAKDAPFAVAMALLALGLVRAFDAYPTPSIATIAIVGIGFGLSFGTRVMGALAVIPAAASLGVILAVETRKGARDALRRAGRFLLRLLPALLIAYAVMAVVWPWSVVSPLNPLRALFYFSHFFEKPWQELYDGAIIAVTDMPRSYVPTLFFFKMPEVFFVLGLAGALGALAATANVAVPAGRRAALLFLAVSALFPIAYVVLTRPAGYNGIRHFVFVLAPFAVLGGLAGVWLIARAMRASQIGAAAVAALIVAGLVEPTVAIVRLQPYEYTYFNALAGGVKGADGRYMLDYWGVATKQAAQSLRAKLAAAGEQPQPGQRWRVAVCGPQRTARVGLGQGFVTQWQPQDADFALSLGAFYCAKLDAPVLVEIAREGVIYARVYDIRGRAIPTLLTQPPP
jgi:4-amino-4-deoxy-L-arabinose transferase-like glycosyltransferase